MKEDNRSIPDKAEAAMKKAVREVIKRHKQTGRPLAIWKNGRTVLIPPDQIK